MTTPWVEPAGELGVLGDDASLGEQRGRPDVAVAATVSAGASITTSRSRRCAPPPVSTDG